MNFEEIVTNRYAAKKFDSRKLPEEKVGRLLELIRLAPSSFNLQPWKIKVVTDEETKKKLFAASWHQRQITTCSHLLVFCADTDFESLISQLEKELKKAGRPEEKTRAYLNMIKEFANSLTPQEKLSWAQKQVYLALGNALNGAKALSFDSCPMEGFEQKQYSQILGLAAHLVPTVVCPIGYATDKPGKKLRFPNEFIVI